MSKYEDFKEWLLPVEAFDFSNQAELEALRREEKRKADQKERIAKGLQFAEDAPQVRQNLSLLYSHLEELLEADDVSSFSFPTRQKLREYLSPVVTFLTGMSEEGFATVATDKDGGYWAIKREIFYPGGESVITETYITHSFVQNVSNADFSGFSIHYIDRSYSGITTRDESLDLTKIPVRGNRSITSMNFTFKPDDSYTLEYSIAFEDPKKLQIDSQGRVI